MRLRPDSQSRSFRDNLYPLYLDNAVVLKSYGEQPHNTKAAYSGTSPPNSNVVTYPVCTLPPLLEAEREAIASISLSLGYLILVLVNLPVS